MPAYSHNGCEYPAYEPPSDEALLKYHNVAQKAFEMAFYDLGRSPQEFYVDFHWINDALIRTDQRKLHYLMYQNGMRINELKAIAVFSYWVLRFKPINRVAGGPININEQVVLSWIFSAIKNFRAKKGKPEIIFDDRLKKDLLYALTYRDISYDGSVEKST